MKRSVVFALLLVAAPVVLAAGVKTYQKTGPVVDVNDKAIVIDAGKEGKWEFQRDAATKVEGDVKKGSKVTVQYRMVATSIEAKEAKKK